MKILAVIPARAGSKGIPNKNIRMVGGHPLVYYAIWNAIHSQYITDVIVTTDSVHVSLIAQQMGVCVKMRNTSLCGDNITLDAVIFDAIPEEKWDYIVSLQPTTPTLHTKTLDDAIKYMIEHPLDTLISAINQPHLSWSDENGKKIPNYKQRLNRQYLPNYYIETGAFMISKAQVIDKTSRIGEQIDIFEVSENEAIDIDNFTDLQIAEAILNEKKVAIYVNGNEKIGTGHVYRALEIADEFYSKPDIFYDKNQTDKNIFGDTTHQLLPVDGTIELFEKCKKNHYDIFINDILDTSIDYMLTLQNILPNAKLINFEDAGEGRIEADLVFNALYDISKEKNIFGGEKYYIASKIFMFYEPIQIKHKVKNVLVTFGGADPQNYAMRILDIITKGKYQTYNFRVVLGRVKKNIQEFMKFNLYENIEIFHDILNMPDIMSWCDIAVTSRGRTAYELAMLGIPSIIMAQNKREEKHGFACNQNGFIYLGLNPEDNRIKKALDFQLISSSKERKEQQKKMLKHDLRNGRNRVMELIQNL